MSWCVCICVYMVFLKKWLFYDMIYELMCTETHWMSGINKYESNGYPPSINQSINQSNVDMTYNLQIYHTMSNNGCPSPTTVNLTTDEILSNLRAKTRKGGTLWMWSRTFRNINWYRYLNIYIYWQLRTGKRQCHA